MSRRRYGRRLFTAVSYIIKWSVRPRLQNTTIAPTDGLPDVASIQNTTVGYVTKIRIVVLGESDKQWGRRGNYQMKVRYGIAENANSAE